MSKPNKKQKTEKTKETEETINHEEILKTIESKKFGIERNKYVLSLSEQVRNTIIYQLTTDILTQEFEIKKLQTKLRDLNTKKRMLEVDLYRSCD